MVLGIVQGGEVGPVVFDLGAISHIETDRPEYGLDTLPGLNDRMDAGNAAPATGQTDVNGFGGQALVQFGLRHLAAPIVQQAFDLLLQLIDAGPFGFFLLGVQLRSEERRVGKECVSTCRYWW